VVFDSFGFRGQKGWFVVGGTSASAPLIAGVYALAGNAAAVTYGSFPYGHTASLFDVTTGSNGACARRTYALLAWVTTARRGSGRRTRHPGSDFVVTRRRAARGAG